MPQPISKRTTVRAMPAGKPRGASEATAVLEASAMAAEVGVAAVNAAIAQKHALRDVQKVVQRVATKAVQLAAAVNAHRAGTKSAGTKSAGMKPVVMRPVLTTLAAMTAVALNSGPTLGPTAKSSASNARRVSRVKRVKVVAKSARAVSGVNAVTVPKEAATAALSSARKWTRPSKILHWLTKQRWQLPWAAQVVMAQETLAKTRHAASAVSAMNVVDVAIAVAATTAGTTQAAMGATISNAITMHPEAMHPDPMRR